MPKGETAALRFLLLQVVGLLAFGDVFAFASALKLNQQAASSTAVLD